MSTGTTRLLWTLCAIGAVGALLVLAVPLMTAGGGDLGPAAADEPARSDAPPSPPEGLGAERPVEALGAHDAAAPRVPVAQPLGAALRDPRLVPGRPLRVSARLVDSEGAPLAGARMTALSVEGAPLGSAGSGADGVVELAVALPDVYLGDRTLVGLEFDAPGYAVLRGRPWADRGGRDLELGDVRLPTARSLSGRLVDEGGAPLAEHAVGLDMRASMAWGRAPRAQFGTPDLVGRTDADGRFRFDGLATVREARLHLAGHVFVSWDGVHGGDAPGHTELGERVVRPRWDPADALALRLLGPDGRALPGARAGPWTPKPPGFRDSDEAWSLEQAAEGRAADAEGRVLVPGGRLAERVVVAAPGHAPRVLPVAELLAASDGRVQLDVEPSVPLRFVDAESGCPLDDLRIEAAVGAALEPGPWLTLRPDGAPGAWTLRDPARGVVRLDVSRPGMGMRRVMLSADVARGEPLTVRLPGPRRLRVRVLDEHGLPRDDVKGMLWTPEGTPEAAERLWGALHEGPGELLFVGLEPGVFRLELRPPGEPAVTRSVAVGDGALTDLGDVVALSYGRVRLTVVDAQGLPVDLEPRAEFQGPRDVNRARHTSLGPGLLEFRVEAGHWRFSHAPGGLVELDVRPGAVHEAVLQLREWAVVEGRVLRAGAPLSGAQVVVTSAAQAERASERISGRVFASVPLEDALIRPPLDVYERVEAEADGRFRVQLEAHGGLAIVAFDDRGNASPVQELPLRFGERRQLELDVPWGAAVLEGRVLDDESGRPASGVIVVGDVIVGSADEHGRFRIEGLQPGVLPVQAVPTPFQRARLPIEVRLLPGQPVYVELALPPDDASGYICL